MERQTNKKFVRQTNNKNPHNWVAFIASEFGHWSKEKEEKLLSNEVPKDEQQLENHLMQFRHCG